MQNYIQQVLFTGPYRTFKAGQSIDFSANLTLLLGDNGCGKSTLLQLIKESFGSESDRFYSKHKDAPCTFEKLPEPPKQVKLFDFHGDDMKFAGHFGDDMTGQIMAMRQSSGISMLGQFVRTGTAGLTNSLILLDEPCRGLSPKWQEKMTHMLMNLAKQNQVIISTHSERMMEAPGANLYSVEHARYVATKKEFLKLHLPEIYA